MKNIFSKVGIITMILLSTSVYGQRLGIKAGLNLAEMSVKDDSENYSEEYTIKAGYNVGLILELPVTEMLRFETGLNLNSKGYKFERVQLISNRQIIVKEKVHLDYLDLPINIKAIHYGNGIDLYGVAGVYVGLGLSGNFDRQVDVAGNFSGEHRKINWGTSETDDLKRFDFGLNLGAGIERNNLMVGANYGIGLVNITPVSVNGSKVSNRVLSISIGYIIP